MPHRINRLAAGLALAGCAHLAHAAAVAQDASTVYFNPTGMTLLPGRQFVAAGHLSAQYTHSV